MRLKDEEFLPFAPDAVGKRQRVNHSSPTCAGDSQSLSVWRNEDGTVGAKCYRCGATGRAGSKPSMFQKVPETTQLQAVPTDVSHLYEDMPGEVATYLSTKGITEEIAKYYGIGWSPGAKGLVLPVHNEHHHDGAQIKFFDSASEYNRVPIRYMTIHMGQRELMFSHLTTPITAGTKISYGVVIVEDLISAIRIRQATEFDAFALLGSELNDHGLSELVKYHNTFIVWLDNDNNIVCGKAKKLFHRLQLFGNARYIKYQCEPKDLTDQLILDALHR